MKNIFKYVILFFLFSACAYSEALWPKSITYIYTQGSGSAKDHSYKLLIHSDSVEWSRIKDGTPEGYKSPKKTIFVKLDDNNYLISWYEQNGYTVTMVFNTKSKNINTISSNQSNDLTSGKLTAIDW